MIKRLVGGRVALVAALGLTVTFPARSADPLPPALSKALAVTKSSHPEAIDPRCREGGIYFLRDEAKLLGAKACPLWTGHAVIAGAREVTHAVDYELLSLEYGWTACVANEKGVRLSLREQPDFPWAHARATAEAIRQAGKAVDDLKKFFVLADYADVETEAESGNDNERQMKPHYQQLLMVAMNALGSAAVSVKNDGCRIIQAGDASVSPQFSFDDTAKAFEAETSK